MNLTIFFLLNIVNERQTLVMPDEKKQVSCDDLHFEFYIYLEFRI